MSKEQQGVQAHPQGELEIAEDQAAETGTSLDTFAGKIHVKWSPEATRIGHRVRPDHLRRDQ